MSQTIPVMTNKTYPDALCKCHTQATTFVEHLHASNTKKKNILSVLFRQSFYNLMMCFLILQDYKPDEDPSKYHSEKTGRGPLLGADWKVSALYNMLYT